MIKKDLNKKTLEDLKAFKAFYLSHTNKETVEKFGFSNETALIRFCKKNSIAPKVIKKQSHDINYYLENINKESFKQDYLNSKGVMKFAKKYNLTIPMLYKILKYFGLRKKQKSFSYYTNKISKDILFNVYITQNKSRADTAKLLNISENILANLLTYYKIKKAANSVNELQNLISRDELENYYFLNTLKDTENYFYKKYHLAYKHSILSLIKYYQIDKISQSKKKIVDLINSSKEKLTLKQIANTLNLNYCNVTHLIKQLGLSDKVYLDPQTSSFENEIAEFLTSLNLTFEQKNRAVLNGQEIDLYIPDKKIGIEFNGDFWHSSFYKEKNYHLNKSKLAKEKGIRLIHIWEHEWLEPKTQEKIKMLLKIATGNVQTKIYARQCELKIISNSEAKKLNEQVHLQEHRNAQVTYGLYYNNSLVQLMSFSKTKYNKNLKTENSWEIIRGCPGSNNIVIGGVSKLLNHFIKDYKPKEIFSYCDFNKFNGNSYEQAGMTFIGYTGPDLKYLLPDGEVVNRNPKKYKELKNNAVYKLYGAGSLKYKLTLS